MQDSYQSYSHCTPLISLEASAQKKLDTELHNEGNPLSPNQDGEYLDIEIRQTTYEDGNNQVFHTEHAMNRSPAAASKDELGSALSARQLYENKPSLMPLSKQKSARQNRETNKKLNQSLNTSKGLNQFSGI